MSLDLRIKKIVIDGDDMPFDLGAPGRYNGRNPTQRHTPPQVRLYELTDLQRTDVYGLDGKSEENV